MNIGDVVEVKIDGRWAMALVEQIAHDRVYARRKQETWAHPYLAREVRVPKVKPRKTREPKSLRGAPTTTWHRTVERLTSSARGPAVSRPKEAAPVRDDGYLRFVRTKPCVFRSRSCRGSVEAHHHGKHPVGRKTDDTRSVPLCAGHHRELTDTGWVDEATIPCPLPGRNYVLEEGMLPFVTKAHLDAALVDLLVEWNARGAT